MSARGTWHVCSKLLNGLQWLQGPGVVLAIPLPYCRYTQD